MKKIFLLLPLAIASMASATIVNCTVNPSGTIQTSNGTTAIILGSSTGGTVANAFTCPTIDAGPGYTITSYAVFTAADYSLGTDPSTEIDATFATLNTSPLGAASVTIAVTGNNNSVVHNPTLPAQLGSTVTPNVETVSGFDVSLNSAIILGGASVSSDSVYVEYTSATPEPATMALTGLALMGLGLIGRKK